MFEKKGNLQIFRNNGNRHHQTDGEKGKKKKTTRNQTILQKAHPRDKHLGCPPCQTIGSIFEVDDGGTSKNVGPGKPSKYTQVISTGVKNDIKQNGRQGAVVFIRLLIQPECDTKPF